MNTADLLNIVPQWPLLLTLLLLKPLWAAMWRDFRRLLWKALKRRAKACRKALKRRAKVRRKLLKERAKVPSKLARRR